MGLSFCLSLTPQLYALIFCNMMSQTQGSIANFFPTIGALDSVVFSNNASVKTLGYDSNRTLLLTAPPYVFAAFWYMGLTALSDVS